MNSEDIKQANSTPVEEIVYRGLTLDKFQVDSIAALKSGHSVLVAAPTGTGKTLVADWIVENAMEQGKSVVYTAPIKALSNQKFRDYCKMFGEENVGLVTGDLVIRREAPCKVMTTEILRNMLLCDDLIPNLAAVIIDEIHFLDDKERGTTWEEVLIYLPKEVQIVGLSATLSNMEQFAQWLSDVRERTVTVVEEEKRAVPLEFFIGSKEMGLATLQQAEKSLRSQSIQKHHKARGGSKKTFGKKSYSTDHIDIFKMMIRNKSPYLYFVFSRAKTEQLAYSLQHFIKKSLLDETQQNLVRQNIQEFKGIFGAMTAIHSELEELLCNGIAFHHAGLHVLLKGLIERLYEQRLIQVLYCTGTFALGINMPAKSAVFDALERYDGHGMIPLPTREFMQMAGRAGRRGLDVTGTVVMRMGAEDIASYVPQIKRYLRARYEPVHSRFSLSFNSVVNLMHRHPPDKIRQLVEKSFLSWYLQGRAANLEQQILEIEENLQKTETTKTDDGQKRTRKERKKKNTELQFLANLKDQHNQSINQTWLDFEERVEFLQLYGYIDEDRNFRYGAKALMHFQIQELFAAELFSQNMFDALSPSVLFGILSAMVVELPRSVRVPESKKYRTLARSFAQIANSDFVVEGSQITGYPITWEPLMIPLGKAWAEGEYFGEVLLRVSSNTDVSGTLIGAFRRAKDLVIQLRHAWNEKPHKQRMLSDLLHKVSRDEVEVID